MDCSVLPLIIGLGALILPFIGFLIFCYSLLNNSDSSISTDGENIQESVEQELFERND